MQKFKIDLKEAFCYQLSPVPGVAKFGAHLYRAPNVLLRGMKYCAQKVLCSNHSVRKMFGNLILNL